MKKISLFVSILFLFALTFNVKYDVLSKPLYDVNELLVPFWKGNTMYNESVLVVSEEDNTVKPISLLYKIENIISIKNARLNKIYEEERDYKVENGKLVILKGDIPVLSYSEFHPSSGSVEFKDRDGKYVLFKEGSWFHDRQIVVTYTHSENSWEYIPEGKGALLPKTMAKLNNKEHLNVLFYGDSITEGANSSGNPMINVSPFLPTFSKMFVNDLKEKYKYNDIEMKNTAVGGKDVSWGLSNCRENVTNIKDFIPDLVILGFGMNDTVRDAESFAIILNKIVKEINRVNSNAEVILLATILPNEILPYFYGNQYLFASEMLKLEKSGVVVSNMTAVHKELLTKKNYEDMTGNNVNHPNDFLVRIYVQVLNRTLEITDYGDKNKDDKNPENSSDQNTSSSNSKNGCNSSILDIYFMDIILFVTVGVIYLKTKKYNNK